MLGVINLKKIGIALAVLCALLLASFTATPAHASTYNFDCGQSLGDTRDNQTIALTGTVTITATNCTFACNTGAISPVNASSCGSATYLGGATTVYTVTGAAWIQIYSPGNYGYVYTFTAPPTSPTFTSSSPGNATKGAAYSYQYTAAGTATITYASHSGTLPTGLSLSSAGYLSGTPSAVGSYTFSVTATNGTSPDATVTNTVVVNTTYSVTYSGGAGTTGALAAQSGTGTSVTLRAFSSGTIAKMGYHFDHWSDASNNSYTDGQTIPLSNALTLSLTAVWALNTYTYAITFDKGTGDSGVLNGISGTAATVTLPLFSSGSMVKNGYHFDHWTDGGASYNDGQSVSLAANLTTALTAVWSLTTYAYTVTLQQGSSEQGSSTTYTGTSNTFTIPAFSTTGLLKSGYHFQGWTDGTNSYSDLQVFNLNAPFSITLTPVWVADPPPPPAPQTSVITSGTQPGAPIALAVGSTDVRIPGTFTTPISNIYVNGSRLPLGSWIIQNGSLFIQGLPSSGNLSIQIYNGGFPILEPVLANRPKVATPSSPSVQSKPKPQVPLISCLSKSGATKVSRAWSCAPGLKLIKIMTKQN